MRTKHVLMAMMLPAVFAACTSDEFVEPTQGDLNGRKLINGLTVNVEQDAETRFQWSEAGYKWAFETGDKFGAAVTDPTTFGTVVNTHMLGNYIFERQANGGYETNSRMVEGTYLFYSYPGFENKASRDLVKFSLGTQKADLSNPEAVINENQLFFSPLYKITAENANMALPLTFQPYWSVAAFKIKNNTGAAFKISQIALKEENAGYKFVTDGEIDPTALNSAKLVYSVPEGGDAYSLPSDMNASKYEDAMATTDLAKSGTTKKENVTIVLNCGNYELANGAEVVAYMSVPAGNHAQLTAEIIVSANGVSKAIKVTESETIGSNSTKSIACTGINTLQFKRGYTKPVFGIETDGKTMKTLVVAANNLQDANGFYVDNKTDLLNVVNANRGDIEIYNSGDLYIDNDIINAIALYTAGKVEFANPIAIKAEGDTQLEVKQMTFNGVTVESGNVKFVEALTGELVVNGGKVTLANDADKVTVNGGELVVAKTDAVITKIDMQNGALTLNGESQTIGTSNIKALTFGAATGKVIAFNLAMSGNSATKTLTVSQGVTLSAITTTTVNANNKITVSAGTTLTNNGVIENNGEIDATSATSFTNSGEIENAKVIKNLTNNSGYVKQTDGWFSSISLKSDSNGLIDNTVGGTITKNGASDQIYRIYTGTNPSTTGLKIGEIAVMKDVTFTQDITLSNEVLFFGETEITSGTVTCDDVVIGVTDEYKNLAAYVLNKTWDVPATNTVNAYNATVGVYVYEGAKLDITTSYETGTGVITLMNKGTVELPSSNSGDTTDWTPVAATAN